MNNCDNPMIKLFGKGIILDKIKFDVNRCSLLQNPVPVYVLTRSVASTNEGTNITFTLTTTNVANGTSVPYAIGGIAAEDLIAGSLTGNFVVNSGSATVSFTIAEDLLTEGTEILTLSAAGKTSSVSILDTSRAPILLVDPGIDYKISRSVASVNEGSIVAYTLSSWFFGPGDIVPYAIGGIAAEDLIAGSLTGNFVFTNTETATLSFTVATDLLTEGSEVMTLSAIQKASSITIVDTSVTPEFSPAYRLIRSTTSTNEGDNVVFTLSSVNVPQGTVVPYKINGISQDDLYAGYIEGSFTIDYDGTAAVGFAIAQDLLTEGTETMTISAANRTASISIADTSLSPQYRIARSAASTDEGTTVTYTLSSDTALDGTLVPYTVTGINAADLSDGSLTGNFEVYSQAASVSFTLANDLRLEGPETMTISAGSRTSSILINDTSLNPLYALSRSAASTNEGTTVTYTLSTARVGEGVQVPYKITGLSAEDLSSGSLEGAFVVDGAGFSTLSFTLANDELTEGTETMTLSAGNRTSAISILDTSKTPVYTLNRSTASAIEGQTVVYTLATTNVPNGVQVPYTITGISQEDLSDGSLTGYFTINSNTASISATLASDVLTEGTETITITVNTSVGDRTQTTTAEDTSTPPQVVLLLNGQSFVDSTNLNTGITSSGSISPTIFKYGSGSMYFSGDSCAIPASSNFAFGLEDFTIECWARFVNFNNDRGIFGLSYSRCSLKYKYRSGTIGFHGNTGNYNSSIQDALVYIPRSGNILVNTWYHFAVVRYQGNVTLYVDGIARSTNAANFSIGSSSLPMRLGNYSDMGSASYIDDFRITKGVALYTSNFTPPTGPLTINI